MSIAVPTAVRRWLVPSTAALAVIAGGVAIGALTNAADQARPPRSAHDLLVGLQNAHVDGLQGTVTLRTDLGLPPLPVPSLGSGDLGSIAAGTHTLRVWYADPKQARVALIGRDSETDVIVNDGEVWVWSSNENQALHGTLPEGGLAGLLGGGLLGGALGGDAAGEAAPRPTDSAAPSGLPGFDADSMVRMVLSFLEQFETDVTTDANASVAGRDAYELTIAPRDTRSLVKSIVLDIDAETNLPLRFSVLARDGGAPAFEVGFTELSLTRPDPAQFEFNPPPGTEVVEADEIAAPLGAMPFPDVMPSMPEGSLSMPRFALLGHGWTSVLAVRVPDEADADAEAAGDDEHGLPEMLNLLPTVSGAWGSGRLLSTRLFSVLLTDDGRLLAGAVPPDVLYTTAADPAAQLDS